MAEKISEHEITSVRLMTLEASEDEVALLVACMNYVLSYASDRVLEQVIGGYRDELESLRNGLSLALEDGTTESLGEPVVAVT